MSNALAMILSLKAMKETMNPTVPTYETTTVVTHKQFLVDADASRVHEGKKHDLFKLKWEFVTEKEVALDGDLVSCLEFNPQDEFQITDIVAVLAVYEGENDGKDWRWLLELKNGLFVYLTGWCDYTGWDCQSGASNIVVHSRAELLPAMIEAEDGYGDESPEVIASLTEQFNDKPVVTWRQSSSDDLGLDPLAIVTVLRRKVSND
jgi:hypothetical protein